MARCDTAAKGRNAEAIAEYRLAVLHAVDDVENAFMVLSQSQLRASELEALAGYLQRARDLSENAYESGAITLTDVLDADHSPLHRCSLCRKASDAFSGQHSGWYTEDLATRFDLTHEAHDRWAEHSQQRFTAAQANRLFDKEVVALQIPSRSGATERSPLATR